MPDTAVFRPGQISAIPCITNLSVQPISRFADSGCNTGAKPLYRHHRRPKSSRAVHGIPDACLSIPYGRVSPVGVARRPCEAMPAGIDRRSPYRYPFWSGSGARKRQRQLFGLRLLRRGDFPLSGHTRPPAVYPAATALPGDAIMQSSALLEHSRRHRQPGIIATARAADDYRPRAEKIAWRATVPVSLCAIILGKSDGKTSRHRRDAIAATAKDDGNVDDGPQRRAFSCRVSSP